MDYVNLNIFLLIFFGVIHKSEIGILFILQIKNLTGAYLGSAGLLFID